MSIDSPSAQMPVRDCTQDNFNYIDTYVEYIAEVILKFDNAIPESKDRHQKELQQHKQFEFVFEKVENLHNFLWDNELITPTHSPSDRNAYQFVKEINPPPPKA